MTLDPLAQLDPMAIGGAAAIFLLTFFALRRICLLPVIGVMEARALRIDAARARRAESARILEQARTRSEQILAVARAEAERIAEAAREEQGRERLARMAKARAEADAILARGKEATEELRRAEQARLGELLQACLRETLARLVGDVDDATVRFLAASAVAAEEPH